MNSKKIPDTAKLVYEITTISNWKNHYTNAIKIIITGKKHLFVDKDNNDISKLISQENFMITENLNLFPIRIYYNQL